MLSQAIIHCIDGAAKIDWMTTAEEALACLSKSRYDVAVVDLTLAGFTSGIYLVNSIHAMPESRRPAVIVASGANQRILDAVNRDAVVRVYRKPVDLPSFCDYVLHFDEREELAEQR